MSDAPGMPLVWSAAAWHALPGKAVISSSWGNYVLCKALLAVKALLASFLILSRF
jgi:hypothetical protein